MSVRVVQLSDTHLSLSHPQRTEDLERCITAINQLSEQPDLVVHSGDITHHGKLQEYEVARQQLDQLQAPYVVMPGNKDNRAALTQVFADVLKLDDWQQRTGFLQFAIEDYSTRLLLLDTVCGTSNKGQLCGERLSHLEAMLAADSVRPAVLFMHHPPFRADAIPDPLQFEDWDEVRQLLELLVAYPNLQAVYCGHVHRNIDAEAGRLPASAITCLAGDLRKGDVSDESRRQPVFRELVLGT